MIKGFLFTITGLFIIFTIISFLIPSRINTVKSIVIHAPEKKIFSEINNLHNWKNWQPFFKENALSIKISQPVNGLGTIAEWKGNKKLTQVKIIERSENYVRFLLMQEGEKSVENIISTSPVEDSSAVQVQWQSITHLHWYPWEKFAGIFIEKLSGSGYEASLNELKKYVEAKP